jgi:hypothetical protein
MINSFEVLKPQNFSRSDSLWHKKSENVIGPLKGYKKKSYLD